MNRPVWISGVGLCTPCGNDIDSVADLLFEGRSAVQTVERFDVSQHPSQVAAVVNEVPSPAGILAPALADTSNNDRAAVHCCAQALQSAGLWDYREKLRIGIVLGVGCEWLINWEVDDPGPLRQRHDSTVETTRTNLELTGPAVTISAACASGNHAFALARAWLRQGLVDVCLAGGCDMNVTPLTLAGFGNLRALSRRNDDPAGACRPFDRGRDGFVIGEGGAVCALELADSVRRRRGPALAEVAGCGASSDAYHLVIPSPDPAPAAAAIRAALRDAHVDQGDIDYINAHGTGTPVGDVTEAAALHEVFGPHAQRIPVSSTKATSGHLLTAAAAFEAVAGILAIQRGVLPPTLNLTDPDPNCALDHVANSPREQAVRIVLSNSFGFGGSNTALVLRKVA